MLKAFSFVLETAAVDPLLKSFNKTATAKLDSLVDATKLKLSQTIESTTKHLDAVSLKYSELTISASEVVAALKAAPVHRLYSQALASNACTKLSQSLILDDAKAINIDTLNVALEKLTDGASKKRIVGLRIIRTGTLLELDSAKSAKWLKENNRCAEMVKEAYTSREEETKVIPRAHELMVRFVPVDFDPHEEESLHSVELENGLPPHSIISASWIKDLSRRYEGQGYANVKINCASPEVANRMILGPTRIGNHSVKVQKEHRLVPICAKCSHHDHFLAACKAERFTCRFCAQEHSSRDCPDKTQTKCTPCGSSQHSSGDERCIESKSRQDRQAEHAPEMRSKFFFTKDQWTYNESINAPWNSGYLCPEIETETSQEQAGKQLTMAAANASQGVTNKSRKINQTRNRQITLAQYSIPMQAARSVQHPGPTPKTQTTPNSSQETTSSPSSLPPAQTQPSIATSNARPTDPSA
ncbi:hypothetical protein PIIN_10733 [Serendipita indica DSM 11827]|uniref:Uncharacterized protein n=1 Tax=Serendipita indica (strain DSM 11827) TaxID=1109443 RepID=G4TZK2_SERID|nr:hypothetical protein PIIN_10733 [Serendipita indica DSM 11827]